MNIDSAMVIVNVNNYEIILKKLEIFIVNEYYFVKLNVNFGLFTPFLPCINV